MKKGIKVENKPNDSTIEGPFTPDKTTVEPVVVSNPLEEVTVEQIGEMTDPKIIPTFTNAELKGARDNIDQEKISQMSDEAKVSYYMSGNTEDLLNPQDVGARPTTDEMEHRGLRVLDVKKRAKSSKAALAKLARKTGMGASVQIECVHSGFHIAVEPLNDEEIVNLEIDLVDMLNRIGKQTGTLIYSNYNVIFAETICRHIEPKISACTLKLTEDDSIFDYMSILDLYTVALGVAKSMYPNGIHVIVPCAGNVIINDGLPQCDKKFKLHLDLDKLLWVNRNENGDEGVLTKRAPNSVTVDEVQSYKEDIVNVETKYTYTLDDGDVITIEYAVPTVSEYLESGGVFIAELREKANEILKMNKEIKKAEDAENMLITAIYLNMYTHWIKSITIDDAVVSDMDGKLEGLKILTTNSNASTKVLADVKTFIEDNTIAVIGYVNMICDTCKSKMKGEHIETIVPLNVYEYFFTLLHSKYKRIMDRVNKR